MNWHKRIAMKFWGSLLLGIVLIIFAGQWIR